MTSNRKTKLAFADSSVADGLIEEIIALRPMLQKNAPEGEKLRTLTPEVDAAMTKMRMFSMILPERWGGHGLSFTDFARVQMEVAKGDPSVSWVIQILNGSSTLATLTDDAIQESIFGDGATTVCSVYNPPGVAKKVDGGYNIDAAWPYSSGSRQAKWVMGGCLFEDTGGPVVPGINMAFIDMAQLSIKDSWYVSGMQGTGSDTTIAKDAFVPDHMMVTMAKPVGTIDESKKNWGAPTDYMSVIPSIRSTGIAQFLGAAKYMLELVEKDAAKKPIVTTTFTKRVDSHVFVHEIGKVAAQLDNAEILLMEAIGQLDHWALNRKQFDPLTASQHKAKCSMVIELVHASIEKLMFLTGSSAFVLSHPLNRYWRDVHMGLRHVQNIPQLGYEIYGRDRLEVSPNITPPGAY